jgi:CubicO group peptidase (beta-lactamase class C family)
LSPPASLGTVREIYDGALTSDIQVDTFRNGDQLFPVRVVKHGARVQPLPHARDKLAAVEFSSRGKRYDLVDYLALNRVTGLLILKQGEIVFEDYELGNTGATRWMSMSLVKSITASLVGAAIHDGYIESIEADVTKYLPRLAGSAYEGVSIERLLHMTSGVRWDETYTNPQSDRRRMLEAQISQRPGAILDLISSLPRASLPGAVWNYSTGETHVAGALVAAAVGRPLSDYLSDRIWAKFGMECDATWWLEAPNGLEIGGSGLSATLRDYGRFGLFLLGGGIAAGERVLPSGWFEQASKPQTVGGIAVNYGYMLWPVAAGAGSPNETASQAIGIFGQHLYMNPKQQVVIVVLAALPKPSDSAPILDEDFFAAAVTALG